MKLLLSKESRETVTLILNALKRSPAWKEDLVIFEEKFPSNKENESVVLVTFATKLLDSKGWDANQINTVRFACLELIRNAFEHGLKDNEGGKVHIRISASSDFFEINIKDPGIGFDLNQELKRQGADDPNSKTCHALGIAYRRGVELSQKAGPNSITALIRNKQSPPEVEKIDGISVFRFKNEMRDYPGYYWRQVISEIKQPHSRVVLDLTKVTYLSSPEIRQIFEALSAGYCPEASFAETTDESLTRIKINSRVVVCLNDESSDSLTTIGLAEPQFPVFRNCERAMAYLTALELGLNSKRRKKKKH